MRGYKLYLIIVICYNITSVLAAENFFNKSNQYKGFYWFEEIENQFKNKEQIVDFDLSQAAQASQNIELRKKQLDDARNLMLEMSFQSSPPKELYKAIRHYKELENQMRDSGIRLSSAWEIVNVIYPSLIDRINNPVNAGANKLKRFQERKKKLSQIQEFALGFDLVLFQHPDDHYCKAFKPILEHFIDQHGLSLDIVDDFNQYRDLIRKLSIKNIPTLIAVSKDGTQAFELIRGMSTLSELENNTSTAMELINAGYEFNEK